MTCHLYCQFPATVVTEKTGLMVFSIQKLHFQPKFLPKTPTKHHKKPNKPIYGFKKPKNCPKTQNQPEI